MGSRPNADVNSCLRWLAPFLETMLPETTANNNRNEKKTCSDYDLVIVTMFESPLSLLELLRLPESLSDTKTVGTSVGSVQCSPWTRETPKGGGS